MTFINRVMECSTAVFCFVDMQLMVLDFDYHTGLLHWTHWILSLHFSTNLILSVSETEIVKEGFHQKKSWTKVSSKGFQREAKCHTKMELHSHWRALPLPKRDVFWLKKVNRAMSKHYLTSVCMHLNTTSTISTSCASTVSHGYIKPSPIQKAEQYQC